jgi:crotonobetainyl-CoA:carnitine CoA-transferase CaiB-like acyl-CoA transferase
MASSGGSRSPGILRGIRVLDLTTTFMGPYCTMLLARLGADVIKVEEPRGDIVRQILDTEGHGLGPVFINANHGKRSLAVDLKDPRGRDLFLRLAATADVVVTNMRSKALERLGITPQAIRDRNPSCVIAHLTGFGPGGPYEDRAAYDDVIQAASGLAAIQGYDGEPTYVKAVVADKTAGLVAMNSILAALFARERTGDGCTLTVPMFESMVAFNLIDHQGGYVYATPRGPAGYPRVLSPFRRPYRTKDGYLGVVVYTDRMWSSFFSLIGKPELAREPRFATIGERTRNIDELYALIEQELRRESSEYWRKALGKAGIPAIEVRSVEDLFSDPHLTTVNFFDTVDHPVVGALRLAPYPALFSGYENHETLPAPRLGEHTRELAEESGLDPDTIDLLVRDGVLVEPT